ncbi:MAG: SMC family ATPase [Microbacterium sp.]|uniref:AAA family ATPase n=1 Tax=Microbacterium sp. TaxID=51671 RepID=UPI001D591320|nr:SMC family ATPase [Microbacterium sp.]MBW8762055.1 SMC family ATPase [Microbacterium sp.]
MRLHRLEVEGFGPFRARQVVDFDAFADDGIFLIAGRTGAGKSSILDAVCFGLYGGVPRYDGGEKRVRSDHSDPDEISEVVVEFSTPAGRFRVTRSPEYLRPAKRGGGMTKQAAGVALDEWTDAGWIGRAARAVDVGNELDEILQLSREQFLQVILLAQNRFSEFLLANSKDRQALLRRLFGTERFDDVQARFDARRRAAEQALGTRLATVAARVEEAERLATDAQLWGDAGVGPAEAEGAVAPESASGARATAAARIDATTEERLDDLRRARSRAEYRSERRAADREDAEARLAAADAALSALREDRRAQAERDRARLALTRLEGEATEISAVAVELREARSAEALRATIIAATKAGASLEAAVELERGARIAWESFDGAELSPTDAEDEAAAMRAWVGERIKAMGSWGRAAELERGAAALAAELQASQDRVAAASARIEAGAAERATLPERVAAVTTARDDARRTADRAADLARVRDLAAGRVAAAREVVRLSAEHEVAEQSLADASAALAAEQAALAGLRRRRLDGFAGELASTLVDGEPCPVCGSAEHPAPATHSDPVSAEDIDEAERVRDDAAERERAAAETSSALRAEAAAAASRADGRTVDTAETELAAATEEYAKSVTAADALARLDEELAELRARLEHLEGQRAADDAESASAREQLALLQQRSTDAATQIDDARGEFATVAERIADTEVRVDAARRLAGAIEDRQRRALAAVDAHEEQQAALEASDFTEVEEVEQALRSPAEQDALQRRIDEHAAQLGKEKATLLELELLTLPEEPIDLAPAEQAASSSRASWISAVDVAAKAENAALQLTGLIESATAEHAATAEDAAEFEVLRGLADTIAGRGSNTHKMTLETFVLAAELEEIVQAANRRLHDMSTGRYQLKHSDALAARGAASGLGIVVYDAFTGQSRPAQSLSGGETFLSSLALALGLAEVVTSRAGGIRLDTLFIDEGFGSLDGDTLEVAMRTLDELRQGGRTVGVISHVEAMQEQIPAQLLVRATPEGPSIIETR